MALCHNFKLILLALLGFLLLDVNSLPAEASSLVPFTSRASNSTLDARGMTNHFCGGDPGFRPEWTWANWGRIQEGVNYLNSNGWWCIARGRSCSRISCSYNSAIYMCNDNYSDFEVPCSEAAQMATYLLNTCWGIDWRGTRLDLGQVFDDRLFNIIVRGDSC